MSEWMASADRTLQDLLEELSSLKLHVKELGEENRELRDICKESGVPYEERLAARRHKRYFARLCAGHPIQSTATASDLVGAAPIVRKVAEYASSVVRPAMIARDFLAAFTQLAAQFPWRCGGRMSRSFEGHIDWVQSLAALEGGRLASASDDHTIKVWELATGACVATLLGHEDEVFYLAVLEGGRLASGSDDRKIKIWDSALSDILW